MAFVSAYSHLRKQDASGSFQSFKALRAVGLAVELGHKAAREKGVASLSSADVAAVRVVGALQVLEGGRWRGARSCTLRLGSAEVALAKAVVQKQRTVLADLRLNIWSLDVDMVRASGAFDMLGDFSGNRNFGISGKVWVELKVFSAGLFEAEVEQTKACLVTTLGQQSKRVAGLGGVLLLAVKVERQGSTWSVLDYLASVRAVGDSRWQDVAGRVKKVARGQSSCKPPLAQVWGRMEWVTAGNGEKVGLLKHFMMALGLKAEHPGQRAVTFNRLLQHAGHAGRIRERRVENRSGRKPWVATKDTYRQLYPFM